MDELPRARLAAALLKIRWDARGRQLEDADFEPLLAAEIATQRGYLRDVASARCELEGLVEPEIVARLEALASMGEGATTRRPTPSTSGEPEHRI